MPSVIRGIRPYAPYQLLVGVLASSEGDGGTGRIDAAVRLARGALATAVVNEHRPVGVQDAVRDLPRRPWVGGGEAKGSARGRSWDVQSAATTTRR